MRILVVEDKEMHCNSARETLQGHEVTIIRSFDEAMDLMKKKTDEDKFRRLLTEAGLPLSSNQEWSDKERDAYWIARREISDRSLAPFPFDAVLTDMMMPMSRQTLASNAFRYGEQVPYGFVIALRAAAMGAKFVAMLTDTNHHQGAMSAALDHLKDMLTVNGAKVIFAHARFVEDPALGVKCYNCVGGTACGYCRTPLNSEGKCPRADEDIAHSKPCNICKGKGTHDTTVRERKDWGQILNVLIS